MFALMPNKKYRQQQNLGKQQTLYAYIMYCVELTNFFFNFFICWFLITVEPLTAFKQNWPWNLEEFSHVIWYICYMCACVLCMSRYIFVAIARAALYQIFRQHCSLACCCYDLIPISVCLVNFRFYCYCYCYCSIGFMKGMPVLT